MDEEITWLEVHVQVARTYTGQVESLLESQGALAITLTDLADTPVLEPGVGETPLWPEVLVTGLFDSEVDVRDLSAVLSLAPGLESQNQVSFSGVQNRDWERAWMDDFKPMKFGNEIWIIPAEQVAPEPEALLIHLDPGLAFGTGTHPTTRLCLEWVDGQSLKAANVIDFGCGSGVLGIAAALKGAEHVMCVDNDPQALVAACDNAARNRVNRQIRTVDASDFNAEASGGTADVILANILAGTLVKLASELCSVLKPGGQIALSGVLQEQAEEVSKVYQQWLEDMKVIALDGWVLISGRRKE